MHCSAFWTVYLILLLISIVFVFISVASPRVWHACSRLSWNQSTRRHRGRRCWIPHLCRWYPRSPVHSPSARQHHRRPRSPCHILRPSQRRWPQSLRFHSHQSLRSCRRQSRSPRWTWHFVSSPVVRRCSRSLHGWCRSPVMHSYHSALTACRTVLLPHYRLMLFTNVNPLITMKNSPYAWGFLIKIKLYLIIYARDKIFLSPGSNIV